MTSVRYGLREHLAEARATWEASGVVEYQLQHVIGHQLKHGPAILQQRRLHQVGPRV